MINSIGAHPDFSSSTITFSTLSTGTDDIVSESGVTISSISTDSVTSATYSNQTVTYTTSTTDSYSSDVYFQISDLSMNVVENNSQQITIDLPCSSTGTTSISYSITVYNGGNIPSWVSIDSSTGALTLVTPDVSSDTIYSFYASSSISGVSDTIPKLIKLTVQNWSVNNCIKCSSSSASVCQTWNTGYALSSGACNSSSSSSASNIANALKLVIQICVGTAVVVVLLCSMLNSTTLLWSLINQLQLFMLLLLTGVFIHADVKAVITGVKVLSNPFEYITYTDIGFYNSFINNFKFSLNNTLLESLGIKSTSSIYNTSSLFVTIIFTWTAHLLIIFLLKLLGRWENRRICQKLITTSKWIVQMIYRILTFGFYIRIMLIMNQYLLVSSINEIYQFDTSQSYKIGSIWDAFVVLIVCILMMLLVSCLSISSYTTSKDYHNKLGEFFIGMNMTKRSKLYLIISLIRRVIFVSVLVCLTSVSSYVILGILSGIQLIYLICTIAFRPYILVKWNVIEFTNELYYLGLIASLFFLKTEGNWTTAAAYIYIWIITWNVSIITIVIFCNFDLVTSIVDSFISIISKCKIIKRQRSLVSFVHFKIKVMNQENIQQTPVELIRVSFPINL